MLTRGDQKPENNVDRYTSQSLSCALKSQTLHVVNLYIYR